MQADRIQEWITSLNLESVFDPEKPIKRKLFVVCDLHFAENDIVKQALKWTLKPGAIPLQRHFSNSHDNLGM